MERASIAPFHQPRAIPALTVLGLSSPDGPAYENGTGCAADPDQPPTAEAVQVPTPDSFTYPTCLGDLTFEQLYQQTVHAAAAVMRRQGGMGNPEDIDDCLQSGYLNLWQKLQVTPDWLADKPKRYIVQAVVLRSKAQRFSHQRHYRKLVYDAQLSTTPSTALTTSQLDTWIDLQEALESVAEQVAQRDNTLYLLALYTLVTDVKTGDVAQLYGHGLSSLTQARQQIRCQLRQALPGYGKASEGIYRPLIRRYSAAAPKQSGRISALFFDAPYRLDSAHPTRFGLLRRSEAVPQLRSNEPLYPTRWRGRITLEALLNDQQIRKVAFAKARSLGYTGEDAQDCFQLGSLNLWKTLREQPDLLKDKGAAWVGIWIAFSGSRRALWKHESRSVSFEDAVNWRASDDWLSLHPRGRPERWAGWATRVDQRIDFALLMQALAQRYESDLLKLYALYSLTTRVQMKDLLSVANAHKNQFIQARNQVKTDLRTLLERDTEKAVSDEFWMDSMQEENDLSYVTRVAERVQDNQRLLLALYIATTSAKRKDVTALFGIGLTAFRKEMTEIKILLAEELRKNPTRQHRQ